MYYHTKQSVRKRQREICLRNFGTFEVNAHKQTIKLPRLDFLNLRHLQFFNVVLSTLEKLSEVANFALIRKQEFLSVNGLGFLP